MHVYSYSCMYMHTFIHAFTYTHAYIYKYSQLLCMQWSSIKMITQIEIMQTISIISGEIIIISFPLKFLSKYYKFSTNYKYMGK
jgi:hypothetical protein